MIRNFYLLAQIYATTEYSCGGYSVEIHAFDSAKTRAEWTKERKTHKPFYFNWNVGGHTRVTDKYYHKTSAVCNARGIIYHYKETAK